MKQTAFKADGVLMSKEQAHVLVADDIQATTQMLQRVFEFEGYRVTCVHDGLAALEAAQTLMPDLILLDVMMPGLSGFEVLEKLRANPITANIPTIMITAVGEWPSIVQGLSLGADDYVRKPFHPRELLARAESKMRARRIEDTLHRRTQSLEALLRASEALNQVMQIEQLLEIVAYLALDLLRGKLACVYQLTPTGLIQNYCAVSVSEDIHTDSLNHAYIVARVLDNPELSQWNSTDNSLLGESLPHGFMIPLRYTDSDTMSGLMVVGGQLELDDEHLQIAQGIARQANLALRNAELFELKANYAADLEQQVEERTRELKSAQQLLIRAEKLSSIGRLAASIAHEINNPLTPIRINLDDMLEDVQMGNNVDAKTIEMTLESVERISRIVSRLLEFTVKRSSDDIDHQLIDIDHIIQAVVALVSKSFEHQKKEIVLKLGHPPMISGSRDGIEQVFLNLLLNASQAMKEGGRVIVQTSYNEGNVVIKVGDNGHGIPQDLIENIFEPFMTTKEDGSGLGLFVSYGIIQNHNGHIEVESYVNKGTLFTVRLPVADTQRANTK